MKNLVTLGLSLFLAALIACGQDGNQAGVTDIGHSVSGVVLDSLQQPVVGARMSLSRPAIDNGQWNFTDSLISFSDSTGHYSIGPIDSGYWILQAEAKGLAATTVNNGIAVNAATHTDSLVLQRPTVVRGRVVDATGRIISGAQVLVPSTGLVAYTTNTQGFYSIPSVSIGDFDICLEGANKEWVCTRLSVERAADTLQLMDLYAIAVTNGHPLSESKQLNPYPYEPSEIPEHYRFTEFTGVEYRDFSSDDSLDVTAISKATKISLRWPGLEPAKTLQSLPLLIKVPQDMAMIWPLEIHTANGLRLPVKQASNDPATGAARFWVLLDSIQSQQAGLDLFVTPAKVDESWIDSAEVFSALNGFAAVYPLDDDAFKEGDSIRDISGQNHHGTLTRDRATPNDPIAADLGTWDPCDFSFTFSVWVRWSGPNSMHQTIFSKRFVWLPDSTRWQWHYDFINTGFRGYTFGGPNPFFDSSAVPVNEWAHLAFVYNADESKASMWVNGQQIDSAQTFLVGPAVDAPLRLGSTEVDEYWNGSMREARIETEARSADWLRLAARQF